MSQFSADQIAGAVVAVIALVVMAAFFVAASDSNVVNVVRLGCGIMIAGFVMVCGMLVFARGVRRKT